MRIYKKKKEKKSVYASFNVIQFSSVQYLSKIKI